MPEETAGAGASTSRPQIPLLDNAGEYGRLYNYVKAVRELLGKGGEAYRRVKTQHPDIDSKIDSGNLRVINDIIFENSNLVGLGGIKREELAKIANYSKVLANAERSGNKIPSLNAVNNVKADYDNIMQEKLEQGRDSYQESKDKLKEIRKEKNKKNGKVVSRVVFGMLAAALALGLVAGFGLGVYGIVQTAMAASFTITSGFAVGGVAVALIAGRAIVKGLGALFRKISSSFKKANAERKEAKAKFKAAKREMNQNRRNDLSNQYARARDNESELISPYPGSEGISTISRSREATVDMVSASELSAISGEFAAERAAREAAEREAEARRAAEERAAAAASEYSDEETLGREPVSETGAPDTGDASRRTGDAAPARPPFEPFVVPETGDAGRRTGDAAPSRPPFEPFVVPETGDAGRRTGDAAPSRPPFEPFVVPETGDAGRRTGDAAPSRPPFEPFVVPDAGDASRRTGDAATARSPFEPFVVPDAGDASRRTGDAAPSRPPFEPFVVPDAGDASRRTGDAAPSRPPFEPFVVPDAGDASRRTGDAATARSPFEPFVVPDAGDASRRTGDAAPSRPPFEPFVVPDAGDAGRRTGDAAPSSEELADPLTPMQEFENKYGSDMLRVIERSYNLHFQPSSRSATTLKEEDRPRAYSALLNDVASAVRMGDKKGEISVNVQVMIDEYLKARGVEISREKAKDPDIEAKDSHVAKPKPDVAVKSEEAPARTDEDMLNELLKWYKGKTLAPSTIMKKLKVDGPKARELADMYEKARAKEGTSEEAKGAPKAPVVEEKKPATPETPKEKPEAPAAVMTIDDEIVADMIKKWSGTYGSTDSIITKIQIEYGIGPNWASKLQKKYQEEMRKREAEASAPEETAKEPTPSVAEESEKKEATEEVAKEVAEETPEEVAAPIPESDEVYAEAEPEDDGWQELTKNALKAGVSEELLNSMRERGMSAEDAYNTLKKDFTIAADKGDAEKEDSDEPGSGA